MIGDQNIRVFKDTINIMSELLILTIVIAKILVIFGKSYAMLYQHLLSEIFIKYLLLFDGCTL